MEQIEEQILQCLIADGRLPMRRIAEVVGVSEQTAARRYRAMSEAGLVRVLVVRSSFTGLRRAWTVRVRCRPDSATRLAEALARRDDTAWIALASGGNEIICTTSGPVGSGGSGVLARLPHSNAVLSFSAQALLRPFAGAKDEWTVFDTPLRRPPVPPLPQAHRDRTRPAAELTDEDEPLLVALARDGRAGATALAREIDWPVSRVTSRLDALLDSGALYVLTDYLPEAFGYHASAVVQLTVGPRHIVRVCTALAAHRPTGFVAATTGSANVMALVICRTADELFDYVTEKIGELPGVTQMDLVPYLRRIKQAGSRVVDGRLLAPA